MRWILLLPIVVCTALSSGCRGRTAGHHGDGDQVELGQNVTVMSKPLDPVFRDFNHNWRKFISVSPQLILPVNAPVKREVPTPPPIIHSECVLSTQAGGYVPQVTVIWNEIAQSTTNAAAQAPQDQVRRFDIGLHFNAFQRNYFSSALSTAPSTRFNLPQNSTLVNNPEAVMLTGPGLFPLLADYKIALLNDSASHQQFYHQTVVVREMSEGITANLRVSRLAGNDWNTEQQFVVTPPVCPTSS